MADTNGNGNGDGKTLRTIAFVIGLFAVVGGMTIGINEVFVVPVKEQGAETDKRLDSAIAEEVRRNNEIAKELADVRAKVDALIADLDRRSADRFTGAQARDMRDMLMYLIQRNADDISELRGGKP